MKNIFIFGGSFDPIHRGHLALIESILPLADELRLVPSGSHPEGKKYFFRPEERLLLLRAALGLPLAEGLGLPAEEPPLQNPGPLSPKIIIREDELKKPQTSYTVDLVKAFIKEEPSAAFHLVVGADQAAHFLSWKEPQKLLKFVKLWTVPREGWQPREGLPWNFLPFQKIGISSSEVRRLLEGGCQGPPSLPPRGAEWEALLPEGCAPLVKIFLKSRGF